MYCFLNFQQVNAWYPEVLAALVLKGLVGAACPSPCKPQHPRDQPGLTPFSEVFPLTNKRAYIVKILLL